MKSLVITSKNTNLPHVYTCTYYTFTDKIHKMMKTFNVNPTKHYVLPFSH